MPENDDIAALQEEFESAMADYEDGRTDETYERYKEAKLALGNARRLKRAEEEADPNHPRGNVVAAIYNNNGTGE